jgi:hypothetical protein
MSVRQRIDQLISDSIDELEGRSLEPSPPDGQMTPVDFAPQIRELAAQLRELTTQVATLTSIVKRLREE